MTIRIGVIGTGMIGEEHSRRITKTQTGADIVAVSDVNLDQAHAMADRVGRCRCRSGHLLGTNWGQIHEEYVLAAIKAGKYVF